MLEAMQSCNARTGTTANPRSRDHVGQGIEFSANARSLKDSVYMSLR